MVRKDLARARKLWLDEAKTDEERKRREESDFLCFQSRDHRAEIRVRRKHFISSPLASVS